MTATGQIRKLLLVIFSAVIAAFVLAWGMIHFYSHSGNYLLSNVLINPDMVQTLSGSEKGYRFEQIEFLYNRDGGWKREQISLEAYSNFFEIIANDKSETLVSEDLKDSFQRENPAILSIVLIEDNEKKAKVFQELQISPKGSHYRVLLREQQSNWVYFNHPGLYQKLLEIILKTAVQGDKVMQDLESESFLKGADHSQTAKAAPFKTDYGSRDSVNLSTSTAVFRIKDGDHG